MDGAHLLWDGCKVAILLLRYVCSHSCTACAGPYMQVNAFREDYSYLWFSDVLCCPRDHLLCLNYITPE